MCSSDLREECGRWRKDLFLVFYYIIDIAFTSQVKLCTVTVLKKGKVKYGRNWVISESNLSRKGVIQGGMEGERERERERETRTKTVCEGECELHGSFV